MKPTNERVKRLEQRAGNYGGMKTIVVFEQDDKLWLGSPDNYRANIDAAQGNEITREQFEEWERNPKIMLIHVIYSDKPFIKQDGNTLNISKDLYEAL